jgi:hypothetical protein
MKIRVTKRLANVLDGVDVSHIQEGDTVDVTSRDAEALIREGWAAPVEAGDRAADQSKRRRSRKGRRQPARKQR